MGAVHQALCLARAADRVVAGPRPACPRRGRPEHAASRCASGLARGSCMDAGSRTSR